MNWLNILSKEVDAFTKLENNVEKAETGFAKAQNTSQNVMSNFGYSLNLRSEISIGQGRLYTLQLVGFTKGNEIKDAMNYEQYRKHTSIELCRYTMDGSIGSTAVEMSPGFLQSKFNPSTMVESPS